MTAIVALAENGKVWMGGDVLGVSDMRCSIRQDQKVFVNGRYVFGFTWSYRMGQILRYNFSPPKPKGGDLFGFIVKTFVPAARQALLDNHWLITDKGRDEGGNWLVGTGGRVFEIHSDWQVIEGVAPYRACGCSIDLSLGSMFSTAGQKPRKRIKTALKASQEYSTSVRGPFTIIKHTK